MLQDEIKSKINSVNACYDSVRNPLSSRVVSKNLKIKTCKTIILHVVLYGCENWSLALREEYGMRMYEISVLRRIFASRI
jgi:hypothetical protein